MKMWEIREGYDPEYMGRRGEESEYYEGFEDGCEHGYKKAMREMRMTGMREGQVDNYGKGMGRMNNRYMPPYPSFRDDDDDDYDDMNMRRRRRDARGRYM